MKSRTRGNALLWIVDSDTQVGVDIEMLIIFLGNKMVSSFILPLKSEDFNGIIWIFILTVGGKSGVMTKNYPNFWTTFWRTENAQIPSSKSGDHFRGTNRTIFTPFYPSPRPSKTIFGPLFGDPKMPKSPPNRANWQIGINAS